MHRSTCRGHAWRAVYFIGHFVMSESLTPVVPAAADPVRAAATEIAGLAEVGGRSGGRGGARWGAHTTRHSRMTGRVAAGRHPEPAYRGPAPRAVADPRVR